MFVASKDQTISYSSASSTMSNKSSSLATSLLEWGVPWLHLLRQGQKQSIILAFSWTSSSCRVCWGYKIDRQHLVRLQHLTVLRFAYFHHGTPHVRLVLLHKRTTQVTDKVTTHFDLQEHESKNTTTTFNKRIRKHFRIRTKHKECDNLSTH